MSAPYWLGAFGNTKAVTHDVELHLGGRADETRCGRKTNEAGAGGFTLFAPSGSKALTAALAAGMPCDRCAQLRPHLAQRVSPGASVDIIARISPLSRRTIAGAEFTTPADHLATISEREVFREAIMREGTT